MKHITIIQLTRLGDIVQTLPLINDIKTVFPEAHLKIIINVVFEDATTFLNEVEVITVSLSLLDSNPKIIHNKQDLLINLNNSTISKNLAHSIEADMKIGFGTEQSSEWTSFITSFLKHRYLNSLNLVDIFRHIFNLKFNNIKVSNDNNKINDCKIDKSQQIAIQCGARNIKRQFTIQQYIDIAEFYLSRNYSVYLLGLQNESNNAELIKKHINHNRLIDTTGKTNLNDLIDIIQNCEQIYTPDTGTMHLAALYKTPITALFSGPAFPYETLAYTSNITVFMPDTDIFKCYPCKEDEKCLNGFECRFLDLKNHFQNEINQNFVKLNVSYDRIGQILTPINDYALIYRIFIKYYFFNDLQDSICNSKVKDKIQRELKIWNRLNINNLDIAEKNLEFLMPLIYYYILNSDNTLIDKAIEFFRSTI